MKEKLDVVIIAFGGNALIKQGQLGTAREQFDNLETPLSQIAKLSKTNKIVITHGNAPQVGNLLLQQESSMQFPKMPLEILVAMTQGQVGFMIEKTLDNELMKKGVDDPLISTVLTYVQVAKNDPAFKNPTKPIGPSYTEKQKGFMKTAKGWRRAVASPTPLKIIEWREIKKLLDHGFIVIACGGGGIPVTSRRKRYEGIEAVIDKDLASAKLGEQINADKLIIATEVEKVALNFQTENEVLLDTLTIAEAEKYIAQGQFPQGSMLPKVQAAINFVKSGKEKAIITSIDKIEDAFYGKTGTSIIQ